MSETMTSTQEAEEAAVDAMAVLRKFDKEADYRQLTGLMGKFIAALAIAFSTFQVYTALFGVLDAMIQRSIHLAFAFSLIYLLYPSKKSWPRDRLHPLDACLSVVAAGAPVYILVAYRELVQRAGSATPLDVLVGAIGVILVLEAARRVVGLPIVIVACVFISYAFLGPYLPGEVRPPRGQRQEPGGPPLLHDRGHLRRPHRGVEHLHLPLHPLRGLPREDGPGRVLHRHLERHRGLGRGGSRQGRGHRERHGGHGLGLLGGQRRRLGLLHHPDDDAPATP